jgi:thiol-disulfide isomerase/thioredoxin
MSRSRLIVVPVVLLVAVSLAAWAQTTDPKVAALEAQIAALEKRLTQLEKNIVAQFRNMEQRLSQGAAAANPLEGEANAAFARINQQVAQGNMTAAKEQMAAFMQKYSSTATAKKARSLSAELQVVGKTSPSDWGIEKWYQGEGEIDLGSDKTTVVVFWEVWCPHCRREVPKMEAMYSSLKAQGLQLVGLTRITKSATEESVQEFIKEQNVSYPMAKENGAVAQYFNVSGIPAAAVVKDGKVIWRGHPARLSDAMIKGWL